MCGGEGRRQEQGHEEGQRTTSNQKGADHAFSRGEVPCHDVARAHPGQTRK
ncbi:Hypothetical protein AA314_07684 [Archangium gephyra]|uniref:Uncharacterized protein n=1 Tax=Archangium gephyra TaxID=48 RepID=A0AAC8THE9_9BACT|nr:Hypothetical protein AA314_07684 [Archangium gephyra]